MNEPIEQRQCPLCGHVFKSRTYMRNHYHQRICDKHPAEPGGRWRNKDVYEQWRKSMERRKWILEQRKKQVKNGKTRNQGNV